jgi:RIO-like serine/threonine protein kinase
VVNVVAAIVESVLGVFHGLLSEFFVIIGNDGVVDLPVIAGDDRMHFCAADVGSCEVDSNNAEA